MPRVRKSPAGSALSYRPVELPTCKGGFKAQDTSARPHSLTLSDIICGVGGSRLDQGQMTVTFPKAERVTRSMAIHGDS